MILEVKNLKTHFHVGLDRVARAVDGIDFQVAKGQTLAIVGESGCGKSQTAFSIMGLTAKNSFHAPDSQIIFEGENLLEKNEDAMQSIRGNRIAMIFQEPMSSLNPLYRIGNQLAEPLIQHQHMAREEARVRGIELLKQVGIPAPELRIDNYPHEMSGGMKQRVMIAMALACRPTLLIADEPTTALDVTIQAQILSLMKDLQRETEMSILIITHDLGVVNQVADDVCVMYAGKVAEYGSRHDIFEHMQHPYTQRLMESIPSAADQAFKLQSIPGVVPSATAYPESGCRFHDRCAVRVERCRDQDCPKVLVATSSLHHAYCHVLGEATKTATQMLTHEERPLRDLKNAEELINITSLITHFPVRQGFLKKVVNHVKAVDNIHLHLKRGETLALVGESGCGKTTAGQSILRLLQEARGRVVFMGNDIMEFDKKALRNIRKHMQIVFQDPFSSLSPRLKIFAIVAEGLGVHFPKLKHDEKKERVFTVLKEVGLDPETADRYPHEFSGGQRQRISIARAMILEPEFLVLDEPTSALDVSVQAQILNLLEEIQARRQLAYLFITHDLGVVEYIANSVAVMYLGKIVEYAPAKILFKNPRHPYTQALLDAVPKIGVQRELRKIEGDVPSPLNPPSGCHFHPRCPIATAECSSEIPTLTLIDETRVSCHLVTSAEKTA